MKYETNYLLADPCSTATNGLLDEGIGIATLGWIIQVLGQDPEILIPLDPYINDLSRDWWVRWNDNTPWHGPLTYQEANAHARRMTMDVDETALEVKYAQVGTLLGTRSGDPISEPNMMIAYLYYNGRQYLAGRMAEYNADKVPPE